MPAEPDGGELRAYLDWLCDVWLASVTGKPAPPKRPALSLIQGGRDDA